MLDRKLSPKFVQDRSLEIVKPEIQVLNSGRKVIIVNGGDQEVIKIELIFEAGRWHEPHRGVSHFMSTLLQKGTKKYNSFQIDNRFEYYGVHLEIQPGFDYTSVALYGLSKNIPFVLDLLLDVLVNPNFPEQELQQAKTIYKQGLKINLEKTSYIASREFRKNIFGENHPYGSDIELSDIDSIEQNHLVEFHQKYFSPHCIILSGKIDVPTIELIISTFNNLELKVVNSPNHYSSPSATRYLHIDKANSVQTSIRMGHKSLTRSDLNYPELLLFNHILGGYFGSRLMKNIREEKGLTYGIHSSIQILKKDSYFVIGADVNIENKELTISEIKNELNELKDNVISQEELEIARNHFVGSLQSELNTPFAHADKIKVITLFDLPENFYSELVKRLFDVNAYQLLEFANDNFSEEELHIISVG